MNTSTQSTASTQTHDTSDEAARVAQRLLSAAANQGDQLLDQYGNTRDGFTEEEAVQSRGQYGGNVITQKKKTPVAVKFVKAFFSPFTAVLLTLAVISFFTSDYPAVVIVLVMVTLSGMLRFIQEHRSEVSADKLTSMVATTVAVQRQVIEADTQKLASMKAEIPMEDVVVGDIVYLAAGDIIPADMRIIEAKDLFISQSSLTGESEPIEKFSHPAQATSSSPLEINNLAFMGSTVVSGAATGIVLAVGDDTSLGGIAHQLQQKAPPTAFEKGVSSVSWVLIRFMLVMVPVVFLMNGFTKGDWLQAFLFAIAVAVGLTPEMLPMIVTANLAKGAVSMSKKRVIVKRLNSIQNFGAMDVLCTDKTGTLTQDHIVLEYHLDIHGNDDDRVLRHAFLNSNYQTGLKNLMDLSIIEYAKEHVDFEKWKKYTKVDEIPFDFNRRRMSVVVADETGKTQMITKGAIEEILSICSFVDYGGQVTQITDAIRKEVLDRCGGYNADGLRVLGVAQKTEHAGVGAFSVADEADMVLIGYLAFLDPPKHDAAAAVTALEEYGVRVKVLTGDNDGVTKAVCKQVGLSYDSIVLGSQIETMTDDELTSTVEGADIFAKLSPTQKARIVSALRGAGHTVGFMGDGINDAAAMRASDVGISVDSAVDIAKESADIILLEKDLMVIVNGVIEGRKIYANIIKYIKMTASSNFGNMLSVLVASAFIPFLPMFPIQILVLNLIYDLSCTTFPWDNVDEDFLKVPRQWDASSITKFMLWIGPTSSVFDISTFIAMYFWIGPSVLGGSYHSLGAADQTKFVALFHAGWFVESLWSQTLIIHMLRTPKLPFIHSHASWQLTTLTSIGIIVGTIMPFTITGPWLQMSALPSVYFLLLLATIIFYMLLATIFKKIFVHLHGELL
ncbi:MAG: magnesium-translocating P-type ATPase [Propionibacteriaceae bacterium]|nr:magnesium-translocating P-type ATPase [Propionibacteriaceae bacterium]